MGIFKNPFKGRQPGNAPTAAPPAQQPTNQRPQQHNPQPDPNTGPLVTTGPGTPALQKVQGGQLNLVNYSPEELMQHVEKTMSTVHFGMSGTEKFKEHTGEFWDVTGPIVLLLGTAGEVFAFIWGYSNHPAWWVGVSILATVIVLEATFAVVSYKSSTIRNRAESMSGGATDLEKTMLKRYRYMWMTLAVGVGIGQAAFLISAMDAKMDNIVVLAIFAVARTMFTLASDYYTAFVHAKKPTEGEEAKAQQAQRAALAKDLLHQKSEEVTIINNGILGLQRAHTNAEIEQDTLRTELEQKKLENRNRIETLKNQTEQARMFTQLGNNIMRALFDPELPDEQRQKLLGTMQGFMSAGKQLPPGYRTVNEAKEDDV